MDFIEYEKAQKGNDKDRSMQLKLSQFGVNGGKLYDLFEPQQKVITESIIMDLVVDCALPLSLTAKPGFKRFMAKTHTKYRVMGR